LVLKTTIPLEQECHKLNRNVTRSADSTIVRIPSAKLNSSKVTPETGMSQAQTVRIPTAKLNSKIPQIAALVDYKQGNQPTSIPHNHYSKHNHQRNYTT
jgi:hypothetical protein